MKKNLSKKKYSFAILTLIIAIFSYISLVLMLMHPLAVFIGIALGLLTIVSGHLIFSRIKRNNLSGKKLALIGLTIGYLYIPVLCVAYIGATMLHNAIINNYRADNVTQLKQLCEVYMEDNNGKLPESLEFLIKEFGCPPTILISIFSKVQDKPSYKIMIKGNVNDYPNKSNTVMITEVTPHKLENKIVVYLDGHIEIIDDD